MFMCHLCSFSHVATKIHEKLGMLSVESQSMVYPDADVAHAHTHTHYGNRFGIGEIETSEASHKCTKNGFQSMLSQIENTIPLCTIVFQFSAICFAYLGIARILDQSFTTATTNVEWMMQCTWFDAEPCAALLCSAPL